MSKKSYDWPSQWEDDQEIIGVTESAVFPKHIDKENYKPRTLVDQTLETLDPTPNVHTLFVQFNEKFFWNKLLSVEVKWSSRMTTCAGTCTFHPRNRECVISLSAPLLKLRPRKDLVETLLHEMIHGFLFLTNNNRDRDGHGPEFCKHMKRINDSAGTKITIYHSFHDEVRVYKQHWWRCNGPCQQRGPYFGNVRRAMNRAPGPNDLWWKEHQRNCNGTFIKIKEPEKVEKSKKSSKISGNTSMDKFITVTKDSKSTNNNLKTSSLIKTSGDSIAGSSGFVKLGTSTNRVHGFGTGGPGSLSSSTSSSKNNKTPKSSSGFNFTGTLGGTRNGKSNLLDKYLTPKTTKINNKNFNTNTNNTPSTSQNFFTNSNKNINNKKTNSLAIFLPPSPDEKEKNDSISLISPPISAKRIKIDDSLQYCPICSDGFFPNEINSHIDYCLLNNDDFKPATKQKITATIDLTEPLSSKNNKSSSIFDLTNDEEKNGANEKKSRCVICNIFVLNSKMNDHLDICLNKSKDHRSYENVFEISDDNDVDIIDKPSSSQKKSTNQEFYTCIACQKLVSVKIPLNIHLDDCLAHLNEDSDEFTSPEISPQKNSKEYPCPFCGKMIDEKIMNQHADKCLL